ncbi:MAG: GNAT family N-acetyltransferase [Cyclobacteriaceae bacterium]
MNSTTKNISYENLWRKDLGELKKEVITMWRQHNPGLEEEKAEERANQIVWVAKNEFDQVIGVSTAFKVYIKQFRNFMYSIRVMVLPEYRSQKLATDLLVKSRDFLESIHQEDLPDPPIGMITLVENELLKKNKREAIWPASKMIYAGNSSKGHHIRVYYFKGATI